jgi:hypothetical protein
VVERVLRTIPREEFISRHWRYNTGEHVTILGPTGSGKSWLGMQLLDATATIEVPAVVLAQKPRDRTMDKFAKDTGFKIVRSWPPKKIPWLTAPARGHILWPKHTFDVDEDDLRLWYEFRRAMMESYKAGDRILFADELLGLTELKAPEGRTRPSLADREARVLWTRGRSMGTGIWGGSQKPTHIPLWAYNQAEHLFIHNDPDRRARERYSEIGGVDPKFVEKVVSGLPKHHFLYIRRDGPRMCVVGM